MDQIIDTLQDAYDFIDAVNEDIKLDEQEAILDKLTILIDQFIDAKNWIQKLTDNTHDAEGEPETHLVQDPTGGEGLANPPATEEDDLKESRLVEEHDCPKRCPAMIDACIDDCAICDAYDSDSME